MAEDFSDVFGDTGATLSGGKDFSDVFGNANSSSIGSSDFSDVFGDVPITLSGATSFAPPSALAKPKEKKKTKWEWVMKQAMKPVGSVASEVKGLGKFVGSVAAKAIAPSEQKKDIDIDWYVPGVGAAKVLAGKEEESFAKIWDESVDPQTKGGKLATSIIGGTFDIALDPLNFIGGGLTKTGKLAKVVTSHIKSGKPILKGSKIAKQVEASGLTIKQLKLGTTKLEQAQQGQRVFLQTKNLPGQLSKPLVKGERYYKESKRVGGAIKATKAVQALQKAFSTKTGIKEFDELQDAYKNLSNYKSQKVIEIAGEIEKISNKMPSGAVRKAVDILENPTLKKEVKDKGILNLSDKLKTLFNTMKVAEKERGLLKTDIQDYFPHIKATDSWTTRVAKAFGTKKVGSKLGAAKERKILKVIDEIGTEKIGDYTKMGLRKINRETMQTALENKASTKIASLQKLVNKLAAPEIATKTADLQNIIKELKKNLPKAEIFKPSAQLINPSADELATIVNSIVNPKRNEMTAKIAELENLVKLSGGEEFLYTPIVERAAKGSREAQIKWAYNEIIETQNKIAEQMRKLNKYDFIDEKGGLYKRGISTVNEINERFGKEFFEINPAVAYAQRGLASVKATTAREFLDIVGEKFMVAAEKAPDDFIESTNPLFKGMKGPKEVVEVVEQYLEGIKPKELNLFFRGFDKVQNWWKSQALFSPSYHTRNMVGNYWSNYLAGISNPAEYINAERILKLAKSEPNRVVLTTDTGEIYTAKKLVEAMKQRGVMGKGQFGSDIPAVIANQTKTIRDTVSDLKTAKGLKKLNPLDSDNIAFKTNRAVGTRIEDNARATHFIHFVQKGFNVDDAARSTKKFLFDYEDLTTFEKTVLKRAAPFYCVPKETEILTKNGWKFYDEIKKGDIVLTYNLEKDINEWQPIIDIAIFDFNDNLTVLKNKRNVKFRFTEDHRFPVETSITKRNGKIYGGERKIVRANEFNTSYKIPLAKETICNENILSKKECALLAWLVTDGYHRRRTVGGFEGMIYQHPKKYADKIRNLFGDWISSEYIHPDTGVICFRIKSEAFINIRKIFLSKDDLPSIITKLSKENLEIMYECMMDAEGYTSFFGEKQFVQKPGGVLDAFQIICNLLGKPFDIKMHKTNGCGYGYVRNRKFIGVKNCTIGEEKYIGKVWCPKTKNSTWIMRQNGKVIITGNTWTRKNIPLQIENLLVQPTKYFAVPKIIEAWEINVPDPTTEKYMSDYIRENIPVKIRKNKKTGNTEYLLLGNWLPSAQAIDFLSQPLGNLFSMLTPFVKTPAELWGNQSAFFRNTLGEASEIEYTPYYSTEFMGIPVRKKVAHLMRNIRFFNDVNKFTQKANPDDPENSSLMKFVNLLVGKSATYDVQKSAKYYNRETKDRINDLKISIKRAQRLGNKNYADKITKKLKEFIKERTEK